MNLISSLAKVNPKQQIMILTTFGDQKRPEIKHPQTTFSSITGTLGHFAQSFLSPFHQPFLMCCASQSACLKKNKLLTIWLFNIAMERSTHF
jgi:hypothetical protein